MFGRINLILRLAIRARRAKMSPGSIGILGLTGRAETAIAPQGAVFVRGELWRARSQVSIAPGETVRVTGIYGLTLDVEAEKGAASRPGALRQVTNSCAVVEEHEGLKGSFIGLLMA